MKARGLPDTVLNKWKTRNGSEPFNFKSIKTLLAMLNAPLINSKDLHLEFIVQMEGKTVLSYYLNQRMFDQMTYTDSECSWIRIPNPYRFIYFSSGAFAAGHPYG